jgi:hypothetical protein
MANEKLNIAVDGKIVREAVELANECDDLRPLRDGQRRFTAFVGPEMNQARVEEIIVRKRKGTV